ncbi:sensor histidine kinase [Mucilaginibacter sp.]|uniref:sensor histidine kinase n=1 Tax=Mucilaginibacter sp. TaxID=1882438 RepID=UPI00260791DA|nr:histidine kinase [Mucilaginibacter sp.]MDB4923452.1 histidine kinase [Mucilaginibacter sp.]
MKFFRKYIFPALYGLLVYFTIRLLHDLDVDSRFWKRSWALNIFEMSCSVLAGYLGIYLFEWLFRYYDRRWPLQLNYKGVVRELIIFISANLVLVNLIFMPMAAFTDDGLSWADVADLNTIPTLYALIYYGIARSSTWLKAYVNNKVQLEKLTNDHLQTELKFLKAQYHPHFLFNALNTIYFQMDEDLGGAKNSIEKFSELLRYQLYDQQQQVPVLNELEYLQSFIDLQKIRSSDKLKMDVKFDKALNGQQVYPLLFLPLVENAFKFIGGNYKLAIAAQLLDNEIVFRVENSMPQFAKSISKSSGIGLENLKRRLDLLYPGKHTLLTTTDNDNFTAELKLHYE